MSVTAVAIIIISIFIWHDKMVLLRSRHGVNKYKYKSSAKAQAWCKQIQKRALLRSRLGVNKYK